MVPIFTLAVAIVPAKSNITASVLFNAVKLNTPLGARYCTFLPPCGTD